MNSVRKVGPAWTLEGRPKPDKVPQIPGPGAYSSKPASTTPSFTISRANRLTSRTPEHPGPGAYNIKSANVSKSAIFGSASRMAQLKQSTSPGPGVYEIKSVITEGPKFSLKGRAKSTERKLVPGPGQYETNKYYAGKSFIHSFSKEERIGKPDRVSFPGPGSYNPKRDINFTGVKFGTEPKGKILISEVPGPGSYNLPSVTENKGYSIYGKSSPKDPERSPGPGAYGMKDSLDERSITIGRSERFKYENAGVPGPGAYNSSLPKSNANLVFGRSKRETYLKTEQNPGPGSYQIPSNIREGPSFSIRPKTETKPLNTSPGPAEYSLRSLNKVQAVIFSKSKKNFYDVSSTPGPGQYSTPDKTYSKWQFGNEPRLKYKPSPVPGPGTYDVPLY